MPKPKPNFNARRERKLELLNKDLRERDVEIAGGDASRLAQEVVPLVDRALDASWYHELGNDVDIAVAELCRLRRAAAGQARVAAGGDAAVRVALERADPAAVIWLTSRVISYMDEQGFPDFVPYEPVIDA